MSENIFRVTWDDYKGNPHKQNVEAMTDHEAMNKIRCEDISYKNVTATFIPPEQTNFKELFKE